MIEQEIIQNQDIQELSNEVANATNPARRQNLLTRLTSLLIKTSYQKGQNDGYNDGFRSGSSLLTNF